MADFEGQTFKEVEGGTEYTFPNGHMYGRSPFHLICSTYSCGTCDGGGCETCRLTTMFIPDEDAERY